MTGKYFLFFCCLLSLNVFSQTIKGVIYDEQKQPVPGAELYLDGTSLWTVSNDNGQFELNAEQKINTKLVVNYLGYTSQIIINPFEQDFITIHLVPKETKLKEVTIKSKEVFKRDEKFQVFCEQFLGTTDAGKSCKILNKEDLDFFYNTKSNRLIVSSEVPIRILNQALGYEIEFSLKKFYINFRYKSIKSQDVIAWMIMGTTAYKDLTTPDKSYTAARKKSYSGSQMQFYRKLIHHKLGTNNFKLLKNGRLCNPDDYFTIADNNGYYDVSLKNSTSKAAEPFKQSFTLEYQGKTSEITFNTPAFTIDNLGNNSAFGEINFTGEISKNRAGDLLPLDYRE